LYPWLIRVGTRSEFDHAFVVVGGGQIIEAQPGGARWAELSDYEGQLLVFDSEEPVTPAQAKRVIDKAITLIGTRYGWTDIARLALRCLGVQWRWLTQAADNERAMICSQLVATCGAAAGLDWLCGREAAAAVTPGDLATRIQKVR
jgi:cell wall-associated NlpC family hydrolase